MVNENGTLKKEGRWARKRRQRKEKKALEEKRHKYTARMRLQELFKAGKGTRRSSDKMKDDTKDKIYSASTYKTYRKQFRYFTDWLEQSHPEAETIENALEYANEYLQFRMDKGESPSTLSTIKSAMAKVFGISSTMLLETPPRERAGYKRSRLPVKSDKHVSEATERRLARFTSATGLRRSELVKIESTDLFFKEGKAYLNVTKGTKGGKSRVAEIMGVSEEETQDIIRFIQSKKGRICPKLHSNFDNHHYRGAYAMRLYQHYARNEKDIPKSEKYIMRKDRAGEVLDKRAMAIVSKNLGHNRISVIAQSYLYKEK